MADGFLLKRYVHRCYNLLLGTALIFLVHRGDTLVKFNVWILKFMQNVLNSYDNKSWTITLIEIFVIS